jgi:hypothetical protein
VLLASLKVMGGLQWIEGAWKDTFIREGRDTLEPEGADNHGELRGLVELLSVWWPNHMPVHAFTC